MDLGWLDEADQRAWWAFLDLWRALGTGMERQLAGVGVSAADYQLLAPLAGADAGMRPRDLCAATGWDRSRVAHQIGAWSNVDWSNATPWPKTPAE